MSIIKYRLFTFTIALTAIFASYEAIAVEDPDFSGLIKQHQAALVTVKYVLHIDMGGNRAGQEQESENEQTCTMISADGLVVCSNHQLGGFINMISRMSGNIKMNMSATPKNFQVMPGDQDRFFDAEIMAVDTELDMVWIQITNTDDTRFSYIDFAKAADASIGDPVITIRRLSSSFGRIPVMRNGQIGGITAKPRKLFILGSPLPNGTGLPVLSVDGLVVGLVVAQLPEPSESRQSFMGMTAGLAGIQDALSGMVLPAADVLRATQRAMDTNETD